MGEIFELIAEQALEKLDAYYDECHICGATDVDLHSYQECSPWMMVPRMTIFMLSAQPVLALRS
ncbi:hypothetical protein ACLOAU_22350 [Niabella sp. CJ426]|jgi:hypothetical protein|uniref:hypothetical protein n=1 Tax=Niabella sp. CJ426 TaxID=3393740 RepID=UPI003D020500